MDIRVYQENCGPVQKEHDTTGEENRTELQLAHMIGAMLEKKVIRFQAFAWCFGMVDMVVSSSLFTDDKEYILSVHKDDWNNGPVGSVAKELAKAVAAGEFKFMRKGIIAECSISDCQRGKMPKSTAGRLIPAVFFMIGMVRIDDRLRVQKNHEILLKAACYFRISKKRPGRILSAARALCSQHGMKKFPAAKRRTCRRR